MAPMHADREGYYIDINSIVEPRLGQSHRVPRTRLAQVGRGFLARAGMRVGG